MVERYSKANDAQLVLSETLAECLGDSRQVDEPPILRHYSPCKLPDCLVAEPQSGKNLAAGIVSGSFNGQKPTVEP